LARDPDHVAALTTRGNALRALGRLDEALADYDRALAILPHNVGAHFNRALCRLQLGDFEQGWLEYEWRWHKETHNKHPHIFAHPLWLGREPVAGKTVLLHAEQGLGDALQFCRFAPLVSRLGANVMLAVAPVLHGLLTSLPGVSLIVSKSDTTPRFDLQCPLLSLPLALGTRLETIPADIPYLAAPAPHRRKWQARLGPRSGPRIGLAWSGNPEHGNDANRSMTLDQAAGLIPEALIRAGLTLHCLQRDMRPRDIPALAMLPQIIFYGADLAEMSDTAALIAELDLVISVDTAVLHLAGALGVPVWGLLPLACDWRWLTAREDTPWYPTMRLFRQPALGAWETVIARVRGELELWFAAHPG
jgi:hypothetical protein